MEEEERKICFCHNVMELQIRTAIRAGSVTLEALQGELLCSTGCGGCEFDVVSILEDELKKIAATGTS